MASRLANHFGIQCFVSFNVDSEMEMDEKVVFGAERIIRQILSKKFDREQVDLQPAKSESINDNR